MFLEEFQQPLRVIRADGRPDTRTLRQCLAPALRPLKPVEDAAVAERIEEIEIAEDRREDGIDQAEAAVGKIRPVAQHPFERLEFGNQRFALGVQLQFILRRFIAP